MVVVTTKTITITPVAVTTKRVRITTSIADTENAPITHIVITGTTILKGIGTIITAIGSLGSNGIDMQEHTPTYTSMEDITAKMPI
jgi:hypothetical protein